MKLHLKYTQPQLDIFFPSEPARHTIIPKGRRFGATHGAAHACIEWAAEGMPILWGDTINSNISRYVERYFLPALKANNIEQNWNDQKKVLKIGEGWVDFRSADRPENWEGFGYRKNILNEAGIILADPYLYTNAVRPMMLDFPDAELYALGVPKGKRLRDGKEHPFWTLQQRVGSPGYRGKTYTSFDNPLIEREEVDAMIADMLATAGPEQVQQEVYGEFIERTSGNPFAFAFDRERHVKQATRRPQDYHYFSIDFNVEPFTAICSHIWEDREGAHFHTFTEVALREPSVKAMAAWIESTCPHLHLVRITGDRGGMSRSIGMSGAIRLFDELRKELRISPNAFNVPPNPLHIKSREDSNYVLANHPDCRIDPTCTNLITDMQVVEVDADGSIIKSDRSKAAQKADFIDDWRYLTNSYLGPWIQQHRRR
jgi:hypothetical protein